MSNWDEITHNTMGVAAATLVAVIFAACLYSMVYESGARHACMQICHDERHDSYHYYTDMSRCTCTDEVEP